MATDLDVPQWQLEVLRSAAYLGNPNPSSSVNLTPTPTPTPADPLCAPSPSDPLSSPRHVVQPPVQILSLSSPDDTPLDPPAKPRQEEPGPSARTPHPGSGPSTSVPTRKLPWRRWRRWRISESPDPETPQEAGPNVAGEAAAPPPSSVLAEPAASAMPKPGEARPGASHSAELLRILKDYGGADPEYPRDVFDVMRALAAANKRKASESVSIWELARAKGMEWRWSEDDGPGRGGK